MKRATRAARGLSGACTVIDVPCCRLPQRLQASPRHNTAAQRLPRPSHASMGNPRCAEVWATVQLARILLLSGFQPNLVAGQRLAPEESAMRAKKKPCKLCLRIRVFLILVGCVVAAKLIAPDLALPAGINYGALVGDAAILAFVAVFAWKWWAHRQEQREQAQRDALEPWRAAIRDIAESRRPR